MSKLYKSIFDTLGNIEQTIPWNKILNFYEPILFLFIILKVIIFIFSLFYNIPTFIFNYSTTITNIIYILISLYLIIKFGPWSKSKFIKKDSNIIYKAGLLLLSSSILGQFIKSNTIVVKDELHKYLHK